MKIKNTIAIVAISSLALFSCDKISKKVTKLKTEGDSLSYAFGSYLIKNNIPPIVDSLIDINIYTLGAEQAKDSTNQLMNNAEVEEFLNAYFSKKREEEIQKLKAEGEKFLAENKTKEGVQTTESGLQYEVLQEGNGPKPSSPETEVSVHYTGMLVDGTVFDSSVQRGQPATFPLNGVIAGWTEGVQLMSVGSKYKFFIPYNLAYGERGNQSIPPFSTLIFEVELLEIK